MFWSRAGLIRCTVLAVVVWPGTWLWWAMTTSVEDPLSDRLGLELAAATGAFLYCLVIGFARLAISRQVVRAYPDGTTAWTEVDETGLRVANGLGETYYTWDQMQGAQSGRGVIGLPDRFAVLSTSLPTTWIPSALVADEVFVRLGLDVPGGALPPASERIPYAKALAAARTWDVTPENQRTLARDLWLTMVVTPKMLILQAALVVVAAASVAEWVLWAYGSYQPSGMPILPFVFALNVVAPWWTARRQVRVLFPVGTTATVRIEDRGIRVVTAVDERLVPWPLLRGSRRRGFALSYPNAITPLMREVIPAELVPEGVLVRLGGRPLGTQFVDSEGVSAGQ